MTTNKTSHFLSAIEKHAKMQKAEIEQEIEEFRTREINEGKEKALKDAYYLIQEELNSKKSSIISDYSLKASDLKKDLYLTRIKMSEKIRDDVTERLISFSKSKEYKKYITDSCEKIRETVQDKECTVYIKEDEDETIKQLISDKLDVRDFITDREISIGGIKVYVGDMGILLDDSLNSRLDEEMDKFIQTCDLKVI